MNRVRQVVLIIALTTLTGCSFRTEVDYARQIKGLIRTSSANSTSDREQYNSSFHVEAEGRINDTQSREVTETRTNLGTETASLPIKLRESLSPSQQTIVIHSGPTFHVTNNIQIGNVYTQVRVGPAAVMDVEESGRSQLSKATSSHDERCERLRRDHEANIRKWQAFFNE